MEDIFNIVNNLKKKRQDKSLQEDSTGQHGFVVLCCCMTEFAQLDIKLIVPMWDKIGALGIFGWRDHQSHVRDAHHIDPFGRSKTF